MTAIAGTSLRAAWRSRLGRGMIGIRRPIARPSPNDTPTLSPVNDPGPVATATAVSRLPLIIPLSSEMIACWLRDAVSWRTAPPSSPHSAARALMVAEVSMTKITFRPDQAAVAAEVIDLDQRGCVDGKALAPLD